MVWDPEQLMQLDSIQAIRHARLFAMKGWYSRRALRFGAQDYPDQ